MSKQSSDSENDLLFLTKVLHALADPVRLDIVRQLNEVPEKACGTFGIDKPKSTMSHHFNVLRNSGVLGVYRRGASLVNYIERTRLDAKLPGLLDSILGVVTQPKRRAGKAK